MTQNTRQDHKVTGTSAQKNYQMAGKTPDMVVSDTPAGSTDENLAAHVPPKLTRAERRKHNQMLVQQIQVQEIAKSDTPKIKTKVIKTAGEADMLPVPATGKGSQPHQKAKTVTAVQGRGRPSEYTDTEADLICAWISSGHSLSSYCKQHGRDHVTIYRWLRERADFHARYTQAHEDRADTLVDEMVEIADDAMHATGIEQVTAAKLRVETRKWIAAKMRASKYGDKVEVRQTGAVNIRIGLTAPAQPQIIDADTGRIT